LNARGARLRAAICMRIRVDEFSRQQKQRGASARAPYFAYS
jgi:hypothetical protein